MLHLLALVCLLCIGGTAQNCPLPSECFYGVNPSGQWKSLHVDSSGNLFMNMSGGGGSVTPTATCPFPGACPQAVTPSGTFAPLQVDSSGNLFGNCTSGCTGSGGSPGGSSTQLQFNSGGSAFGGVTQWTTNGTTGITGSATSVFTFGDASTWTSSGPTFNEAINLPTGSKLNGTALASVFQAALTGTGLARNTGAATELSGAVTTSGTNATTLAALAVATGNIAANAVTSAKMYSGGGTRTVGWGYGDLATGSALTTSEVGYVTLPHDWATCTISGWHIMVDAGTVTIKTARVATGGSALPTIGSNSISTSGVSLASGTKIDSTTVTDFTSTTLSAGDTLGFFITAVATAKQITFQLDCDQ